MSVIAAQAIGTGLNAGLGIYQAYKGNQMAKNAVRPEYEIPQEIRDNLTDAEIQAMEGLPAAQKNVLMQNIQRSSQASMDALDDRKSGLAGMAKLQQNELDAYANLAGMNAQAQVSNQQNLQAQRGVMANYEDKSFQYNQDDPYQAQVAAAEAMKGAGIQNVSGAINNGIGQYADYQFYQDVLGRKTIA